MVCVVKVIILCAKKKKKKVGSTTLKQVTKTYMSALSQMSKITLLHIKHILVFTKNILYFTPTFLSSFSPPKFPLMVILLVIYKTNRVDSTNCSVSSASPKTQNNKQHRKCSMRTSYAIKTLIINNL